jgi:hypothetical protein
MLWCSDVKGPIYYIGTGTATHSTEWVGTRPKAGGPARRGVEAQAALYAHDVEGREQGASTVAATRCGRPALAE